MWRLSLFNSYYKFATICMKCIQTINNFIDTTVEKIFMLIHYLNVEGSEVMRLKNLSVKIFSIDKCQNVKLSVLE